MSVIDPFLDRSQNSAPARLESREMAMLRHDIRGALMGVTGAAAYLETAEFDAELRPQIERICAASRVLASLVGTALGEEPDPDAAMGGHRVETAALIAHLRRRHAAEAADRGLRFVAEAGEGAPLALRIDPTALCRIVDNLVGNAIKFCQQGSIRLSIARGADGSVVLRVADDGPGLGGESAALSARAGEGLGLEIVRTLAERLGAEASIGNRPAGGVEAVLRFPPRVADERPAEAETRPGADLAGIRVLLAEDNPTNQMVASQMLRALNAEVTVCADGIEALERFEQEAVDLVVVDIEMPRLSGLDVIRAIRARGDDRAQVPIVALTAYAMREHRERIAAAGANGLISKPITSVEELGRSLAAHVARPQPAAPEAPPADAAAPVIVQATYDALVEAIGAETMGELLDKVIADLLAAQRDLAAALQGIDRAAIRSATHILISVAGAVGAARLQGCARELNAIAQGEAPGIVEAATRRCVAEIDTAVAFARDRRAAG